MSKFRIIAVLTVLAMLSLLFGACTVTGTNESSVSTPIKGDGNFRFLISDEANAIEEFSSVNITISKIGLKKAGESGNWTEFVPDITEVDLKPLVGENATEIWNGNLTPGEYTKVFIYVTEVKGILSDNVTTANVTLPSSKLQISKPFMIAADNTTNFVYDITVVKAGKSGKYILKPQIAESGADKKFKEIEQGNDKGNKPEKPGKPEKQGEKGNSDKYNGTIDNATGTSWTVFIKGKIRTVDVSSATVEGEPDPGDPVKIVGVEVGDIIIADKVEVKEPETD
ncbi:MAG: DUF4382 domain-containing protein [Dehalococcoidales bacterium]|nr:MAG: DUF4382 domain-containing protein [Dehalococcoidales bacterium]